MYGNPPTQGLHCPHACGSLDPPLGESHRPQVTRRGQRGVSWRRREIPVLRPTEAGCLVWPSFLLTGQPYKEPDSGLRPELAVGLSAYQVLAPDPPVQGEHMTS